MSDDYDTKDDGVKLHLRESEALRKQWVTYVFETVQKLHDRVEANTLQVQKEREEVFHKLVDLKEKLESQLKNASKEQLEELEKVDRRLTEFIQELADKIHNMNVCVGDSLEEQTIKANELTETIKNYVDKKVEGIEKEVSDVVISQTEVKTKVAVYIAMVTLGTTTLIGVLGTSLVIIFKDAIRAWLG